MGVATVVRRSVPMNGGHKLEIGWDGMATVPFGLRKCADLMVDEERFTALHVLEFYLPSNYNYF